MTTTLSRIDLPFICRICLQKKENMISIYNEINVIRMIEACTSIKVTDHIPKMLCEECKDNFNKFYKFRIFCESTDQILQNIIENNYLYVCKKLNADFDYSLQNLLESNPLSSIKLEEVIENDNESVNQPASYVSKEKKLVPLKSKKINELQDHLYSVDITKEEETEENIEKKTIADCDIKPFVCNVCNKIFKTIKNLRYHKYIHGERKHVCEFCGKKFKMAKILTTHLLTHKPNPEKLPCIHCGKKFNYKFTLRVHIKRYHEGKLKKTLCTVCGKEYVNIYTHRKTHSKDTKKKTDPDEIQKSVKPAQTQNKQNLNKKKVLCTTCGKGYPSMAHLKSHMVVHSDEKLFSCEYCEKSFKLKSSLKIHTRIHTGVSPYVCKQCPKSFKSCGSLIRHVRVHTNSRPYVCKVCDKGFKQSSTLKTHMKVHS